LPHTVLRFSGRWIGPALVIALCAFFAAQAAGTFIGIRVDENSAGTFPRQSDIRTGKAAGTVEPRSDRTIVARNLFCSTCKGAEPLEGVPLEASAPSLELGHLQLLATLVSEDDPAWSFGAIRDTRTDAIGLYGVGSRLPGGAVVAGVEERRVTVEQGTATGQIELQSVETSAAAKPGAARSPLAGLAAGVRQVGEGRFVVDRELIKKLAHSPDQARWARIVPRVDDKGRPAGFTLYRIHPSSIFALLGLKSGDAIRAVNGRPLTPEVALSLYSRLQSTSHVQVSFDRRGKTLTYDFTIQ